MIKLILAIILFFITNTVYAATTTTFLDAGTAQTGDATTFWTLSTLVGNGTLSSNSSVVYPGSTDSLDINSGTIANGQTFAYSNATPISDSGTQISFYFRTDTIPQSRILGLQNVSSLEWCLILGAGGKLVNTPQGATAVTGSTVLSANTWYRISVSYYVQNLTTFTFKVYVNGVLDSTANAGTMSLGGQTNFYFRISVSGGITNANNYYDNVYVATGGASTSSQPDTGNILVTAKRPKANGTTNGFTTHGSPSGGTGTGHAPYVSERPLDTSAYVSVNASGSAITEEYNIENPAQGDTSIRPEDIVDSAGWVYASATTPETLQIILNGISSNITLGTSNTLFINSAGSTSYPARTGADIGITTTAAVSTVSLYEAGVLIAYKPTQGFRQFL